MAIAKCKSCGAYNGYEEWPDEAKQDYTPDKCYNCTSREEELKKDRGEIEEEIPPQSEEPSELPAEPVPTVEEVGEENLEDFDDEWEEEEAEEDGDCEID